MLFERPLSHELHADAQRFADATDSSDFGPLLEQYVSLPRTDAELDTMATGNRKPSGFRSGVFGGASRKLWRLLSPRCELLQ